jgi:uncharacterized protein with PIN domain
METTDGSGNRGEARELRFAVDFMAGRLARWLRILGFDTLYFGRPADAEMMRTALAEGRIVVTRNRSLTGTERPAVVVLDSQSYEDQLDELNGRFTLPGDTRPFTRCSLCNASLVDLPRAKARGQVPPFIFETHAEFGYCPGCARVYWRGSHWDEMRRLIARLEGGPQRATDPHGAAAPQ